GDEVLGTAFGGDDPGDVTATMNGHRVLVKYRGRAAPFSIAVPRETDADAIAAELRSLTHEFSLRDALVALARRFPSRAAEALDRRRAPTMPQLVAVPMQSRPAGALAP